MRIIKSQTSAVSISKKVEPVMSNRFVISVANQHPCFDAIVTSILNMEIQAEQTMKEIKNTCQSIKESDSCTQPT